MDISKQFGISHAGNMAVGIIDSGKAVGENKEPLEVLQLKRLSFVTLSGMIMCERHMWPSAGSFSVQGQNLCAALLHIVLKGWCCHCCTFSGQKNELSVLYRDRTDQPQTDLHTETLPHPHVHKQACNCTSTLGVQMTVGIMMAARNVDHSIHLLPEEPRSLAD